jgi:hypothetical protein
VRGSVLLGRKDLCGTRARGLSSRGGVQRAQRTFADDSIAPGRCVTALQQVKGCRKGWADRCKASKGFDKRSVSKEEMRPRLPTTHLRM